MKYFTQPLLTLKTKKKPANLYLIITLSIFSTTSLFSQNKNPAEKYSNALKNTRLKNALLKKME